jgi:hypothetical protein
MDFVWNSEKKEWEIHHQDFHIILNVSWSQGILLFFKTHNLNNF